MPELKLKNDKSFNVIQSYINYPNNKLKNELRMISDNYLQSDILLHSNKVTGCKRGEKSLKNIT